MKLKEAQMLGILALIAVGIILLCMWGGETPASDAQAAADQQEQVAEPEDQAATPSLTGDLAELYRELRAPDAGLQQATRQEPQPADIEIGGSEAVRRAEAGASEEYAIGEVIETHAPDEIPLAPPAGMDRSSEPSQAVRQVNLSHRVSKGETLSAISRKYYGTTAKWRVILEANADMLDAPEKLRPGMKLKIPTAPGVRAEYASTGSNRSRTLSTQASSPRISSSEPEHVRTHTVRKKDTLWRIAVEYYKDGSRHKEILTANRDKLDDPMDLRPGMKLVIP